jgi:hypothetical protein
LIDIPGKLKVLRFREEELASFKKPVANAEDWGKDFFAEYLQEAYPDWYEYARMYDDMSGYYFVILTEGPIPVLSSVEYDEEGKSYIKETVLSQ